MTSTCEIASGLCMIISVIMASLGIINYAIWFAVIASYLLQIDKHNDLVG
jgi:hypothetical protein